MRGNSALWFLLIFAVKIIYFYFNPPECECFQTHTAGIFNISIRHKTKNNERSAGVKGDMESADVQETFSTTDSSTHTHGSDWSRAPHTQLWLVQSCRSILQRQRFVTPVGKNASPTWAASRYVSPLTSVLIYSDIKILLLHLFFRIMETIWEITIQQMSPFMALQTFQSLVLLFLSPILFFFLGLFTSAVQGNSLWWFQI